MPGLVLEGGTFRPVFSCGVMDALLDNDIMFDYVIGVSAGITYAASYLSRQRERNINILRQYRGDKRYFGARNLLHDHSIFGTDFVFDTIPNQLVPFDWDEFHKYQGKYLVGVTNAKTGKAEYLDGMRMDRRARCCERPAPSQSTFRRCRWTARPITTAVWPTRSRFCAACMTATSAI